VVRFLDLTTEQPACDELSRVEQPERELLKSQRVAMFGKWRTYGGSWFKFIKLAEFEDVGTGRTYDFNLVPFFPSLVAPVALWFFSKPSKDRTCSREVTAKFSQLRSNLRKTDC